MDKIKVFPDVYRVSRTAAEYFVSRSQVAIKERGRFAVALCGGTTPEQMYALLATEAFARRVKWEQVHLFWGDERCVPPNNIDSNYWMVRHAMLDTLSIPPENIHRIHGEMKPDHAAADYDTKLREFFAPASQPRFDLVLLGMGADGHTASLFPHSQALEAQKAWVVANYIDEMRAWRVTLTANAINQAANVVFLVTGSNKARTVKAVLEGEKRPTDLPAQMIDPEEGELFWLLDEEAASLLEKR